MQPLKLKEYLATGRPAVVRDLPATRDWADCLDLACTPEEFARWCGAATTGCRTNSTQPARLADESWDERQKGWNNGCCTRERRQGLSTGHEKDESPRPCPGRPRHASRQRLGRWARQDHPQSPRFLQPAGYRNICATCTRRAILGSSSSAARRRLAAPLAHPRPRPLGLAGRFPPCSTSAAASRCNLARARLQEQRPGPAAAALLAHAAGHHRPWLGEPHRRTPLYYRLDRALPAPLRNSHLRLPRSRRVCLAAGVPADAACWSRTASTSGIPPQGSGDGQAAAESTPQASSGPSAGSRPRKASTCSSGSRADVPAARA